jgi:hypothetical protein
MANTVIQIKSSGVVGNVPSTLFPGELAINYEDGKLYYGDSANQTVLFDAITEPAGLDGEIQFNNLGSFGSDGTLTFNDSTKVLSAAAIQAGSLNVEPAIQSAHNQANTANSIAQASFDEANTKVDRAGDAMTGDLSTTANLDADIVFANTIIYAGIATYAATLLPNTIAQFTSNANTYVQVNQQNIDEQGTADYVVTADVGNDTNFYIDLGITNSQYNNQNPNNSLGTSISPLDGYLVVKGSDINQLGGNLVIGTTSTEFDGETRIIAGGINDENVVARFTTTGANVKGTLQVSGEITSPTTTRISLHANAAFDFANTISSGSADDGFARLVANAAYVQANTATILAQAAYDEANTGGGGSGTADFANYFPIGDWGNITDAAFAGLSYELVRVEYDCRDEPITPQGYDLEIDFEYLT